jgi:prevent-host-death family protein
MKQVQIAELKDHLSQHLRAVQRGEEIEVTDRKRPVARIVPIAAIAAGCLRQAEIPVADLRNKRHRPAGWPVDSLALLREERKKR